MMNVITQRETDGEARMIDRELTRGIRPPDLSRLGRKFDGGYVVPLSVLSVCDAVVGLGVRDDWSFETAASHQMQACRCIHLYDPTVSFLWLCYRSIRTLPKSIIHLVALDRVRLRDDIRRMLLPISYLTMRRKGAHFREWAGGEKGLQLCEIVQRAKSAGATAVVLKVDIEGAEYGLLKDIELWAKEVSIIVVEFHGLDGNAEPFDRTMRILTHSYTPVHIHGNSGAGQLPCGFPCVPEITFVRSDLLDTGACRHPLQYPVAGLDQPNHRGHRDLVFQA
jgi:hypothetical protein